MKVYHGTSEEVARMARTRGLLPREASGSAGQWTECPSRGDMIYLSRSYAPYFAACASDGNWGLVEVDTDLLNEESLHPDEDFLEQVTRGRDGIDDEIVDRTRYYREILEDYQEHWALSVEHLGNCAHLGAIPPDAITGVVIFDPQSNPGIAMMAMDPQITILNHRLLGATKYNALTDWFFGFIPNLSEIEPSAALVEAGQSLPDPFHESMQSLHDALRHRAGLEIIE